MIWNKQRDESMLFWNDELSAQHGFFFFSLHLLVANQTKLKRTTIVFASGNGNLILAQYVLAKMSFTIYHFAKSDETQMDRFCWITLQNRQ